MATIARRLTPQPIKLRADIEVTCYTPSGIDAIKKALKAGETASTEAVPIKAKLVAPPLYVLSTNATDKVCDGVVGAHRVTLTGMTVCRGGAFRACH
jgi:translation initiation factor 2 subunit 1